MRSLWDFLERKKSVREQRTKKLHEIAQYHKDLPANAAPGSDDRPEVVRINKDELPEQTRKPPDPALEAVQPETASASAQRGQLAMTQRRYRDAAQHFADAAKRVPEDRTEIRLGYLQ